MVDSFVLLPCATNGVELLSLFAPCSFSCGLVELVDFSVCAAATSVELLALPLLVEVRSPALGFCAFVSDLIALVAGEVDASGGTGKVGTFGTIRPRVGFPCNRKCVS